MRRWAKQDRGDKVRSSRDYQTLHERQGVAIKLDKRHPSKLTFCSAIKERGNVPFTGAGAYMASDTPANLKFTLTGPGGATKETAFTSEKCWHRVGLAVPCEQTGTALLTIDVPARVRVLHIWGLDCGALQLPEMVVARNGGTERELNSTQAPECLYLPQERAIDMDPVPTEWQGAAISDKPGQSIVLKKCAYCQRLLPIDPKRPSALAFHKHNAKKTGHQNECRSCKKWRINNEFNPKRTTDQFHESSVISRERKIFLREPKILERIKDRNGAGLKSIVWEKFGRRCFRCRKKIALDEVQLDHTRPFAYLWPIDEYSTCLCADCNGFKRERFPVDVYTERELKRLSAITGLAYTELVKKEVNQRELKRILRNIVEFAKEWDPRTFNAIARKVKELLPKIDLFKALRKADEAVFEEVIANLQERPESVEVASAVTSARK